MGLPFRSGHVLGLRRFPASSIGPGYRSVWHRDPGGRWTFYQDQPAELACTRYFGTAVEEVREGPLHRWTAPWVPLRAGRDIDGGEIGSTPVTASQALRRASGRAWLRAGSRVTSRVDGPACGRPVRLTGVAPRAKIRSQTVEDLGGTTVGRTWRLELGFGTGPRARASPPSLSRRGNVSRGSAMFTQAERNSSRGGVR